MKTPCFVCKKKKIIKHTTFLFTRPHDICNSCGKKYFTGITRVKK